jgi:hypothetical protein
MKFKTTERAIKEGYFKVFNVGYGKIETLLRYKSPIAYTCGVYGWNADFYETGGNINSIISTGYRGIGELIDYKILKKYEDKARKIVENGRFENYKKTEKKVNNLFKKFIAEIEGE